MDFVTQIRFLSDNREHLTKDNLVKGARRAANDGYDLGKSFVDGFQSLDEQLTQGLLRTIEGWNFGDSDRQIQIAGENEAFVALIDTSVRAAGKGLTDPITYLVGASLEGAVRSLPPDVVMGMTAKISSNAYAGYKGKSMAKDALAEHIAKPIINKIVNNRVFKALAKRLGMSAGLAKTGIGLPVALLLTQGFLQEASKGSRRLQALDPNLFSKLRGNPPSLGSQIVRVSVALDSNARMVQNAIQAIKAKEAHQAKLLAQGKKNKKPAGYDMLYFLAEPYIRPYIAANVIARNNRELFAKFAKMLEGSNP